MFIKSRGEFPDRKEPHLKTAVEHIHCSSAYLLDPPGLCNRNSIEFQGRIALIKNLKVAKIIRDEISINIKG